MSKIKTAPEFLKEKIGHYNPSHPVIEGGFDYEDLERWLEEYRSQQGEDKWVDVRERLPRKGVEVDIVYYRELDGKQQTGSGEIPFVNTQYWKVSHWKYKTPLPPAPKQY